MTYLKDAAWLLLLVAFLPLWMAVLLPALAVVVVRHLYWWLRGNSTPLTRRGGRPRRSLAERWSSVRGRWHSSPPREVVEDLAARWPQQAAPVPVPSAHR